MKKGEILIYSLFAIGIVLKLFKLPLHTVFILVTLLTLLLYYTFCLIRKSKDFHSTLTGFVTVLWLFCLLAILKHFTFQNIILIIAIVASIALIALLWRNNKLTSRNSVVGGLIIAATLFFKFLPAHHTYYLTNIKFNYEIEKDYLSWDKYSWFLYTGGKEEHALEANKNAQKALESCLANPEYLHGHETEYKSILKEHQLAIENKSWVK